MNRTLSSTLIAGLALAVVAAPSFAAGSAPVSPSDNLRAHSGELTPASTEAPQLVVRNFLDSRHAGSTLDSLRTRSEFQSPTAGVTHLRMTQEVDGLPVFGSYVRAAVNEYGELVHVLENLVTPAPVTRAVINDRQALSTALNAVQPWAQAGPRARQLGNVTEFGANDVFFRGPRVERVALPMNDNTLEEAFLVEVWTKDTNLLHHVLVSGEGDLVDIQLRTNTDSYAVFADHPGNGNQVVQPGAGSGNAESPNGWLGGGTQRSTHISGNNVSAYLDRDSNNAPDSGGVVVSDGNFVTNWSANGEPETTGNREVAVQNLFYLNNIIHDKLYRHGFVESTGNFQINNFGKGGSGNDAVLAEAQDGSGTNNANFSTPNDGSNGRMQMYVWTYTTPKRDGDLDSDIVWHEYGHGLTWRMIGNMSGPMSGAIGEGMSDVLSLLANNDPLVGEYSTNDPFGIRSASYAGYTRTYGDMGGSSVHYDGEIYAATMWDLMQAYDAAQISRDVLYDDIIGGMNFTPSGPSMDEMRDGILAQADSSRDCIIWTVFAAHGIGEGASASTKGGGPFGGGSITINESFTVPTTCGGGGPGPGTCTENGGSCRDGATCCSGTCSGGKPSSRTCI